MQELVIATTNDGKLEEFKELMKEMKVELKSLKELAGDCGSPVGKRQDFLPLMQDRRQYIMAKNRKDLHSYLIHGLEVPDA